MRKEMMDRTKGWKRLALGVALGLGTIVSGALITALLIYNENIGVDQMGYGAVITMILASIIAAVPNVIGSNVKKLIWAVSGGICLWGVLMICNLLIYGGELSGAGVSALLILGGSAASVMLFSKRKSGKKYHIAKR